ncbi:TIGR02117 family protein [Aureimonas glaciei]|uniref:TIGR02117 family protein n=1 Tax=Aureimonas glaciei TaxID=1776957 RepID=A0A916YDQ9_9HYPH|nr:TIGR02117 family protein [Aureimonas glaciei]GGD40730.1 hypothetical protein GCM10011335_49280 [Aureimonas glaciei]
MRGRGGRYGLAAVLMVPVLALVLGVVLPHAPDAVRRDPLASSGARHRVLILSNAIHTDIALPAVAELRAAFGFLGDAGLPVGREDVAAIVVGRGGRDFYLATPEWTDLRLGTVLRAFAGDAAVLHVGLSPVIDASAPGVTAIDLDDAGLAALTAFVLAAFSRDAAGAPVPVDAPGYGSFDRFYEAEGRFTALAGCNAWTAAALRAAGIPTGLWTPLPATLLWSLDWHRR